MPVKLPPRRLCGTAEAADIYGCTQEHIRMMVRKRQIWFEKIGPRALVVDADELHRLAKERQQLRRAGKLCGRRPGDKKSA
jgi:hypothetical protein